MSKGNFREIVATSLMQQHLFINRDDARLAISIMIDELVRLAVHEGYVEVRGLGTFRKVIRKPRDCYNPKTMAFAGRKTLWAVVFRPGVDLMGVVKDADKEAKR